MRVYRLLFISTSEIFKVVNFKIRLCSPMRCLEVCKIVKCLSMFELPMEISVHDLSPYNLHFFIVLVVPINQYRASSKMLMLRDW